MLNVEHLRHIDNDGCGGCALVRVAAANLRRRGEVVDRAIVVAVGKIGKAVPIYRPFSHMGSDLETCRGLTSILHPLLSSHTLGIFHPQHAGQVVESGMGY
jgi:hypothetical protein